MTTNARVLVGLVLALACGGLGGCQDAGTDSRVPGHESLAVSVLLPEYHFRLQIQSLDRVASPGGVLVVEVDQSARARLLGLSTADGIRALESPAMNADALVDYGTIQAKEAMGGAPPDVLLLIDRRCSGRYALEIVQSLRPDIFEVRSLNLGLAPADNPALFPVVCGVDAGIRQNLGALIIGEKDARFFSWGSEFPSRDGINAAGSRLHASGEEGMVTLTTESPVTWGRVADVLLELLHVSGTGDAQLFLELHGLGWGVALDPEPK